MFFFQYFYILSPQSVSYFQSGLCNQIETLMKSKRMSLEYNLTLFGARIFQTVTVKDSGSTMKQGSGFIPTYILHQKLPLVFQYLWQLLISGYLFFHFCGKVELLEEMCGSNNVLSFTRKPDLVCTLFPLFANVYYSTCRKM